MSSTIPTPSALARLVKLLCEQGGLMATLVVTDELNGRSSDLDPALAASTEPAQVALTESVQATATGPAQTVATGPVQAAATGPAQAAATGPAQAAAAGPRAEGAREEYELLVETIYEGYLLHYGAGRVVAPVEADLGLLAGDRLYALGLARLVALGDTEAVAELADTITLSALAQAADDPELARAVWEAGAHAVGWGSSEAHAHAKRLAFNRSPKAIEAMRTSVAGLSTAP